MISYIIANIVYNLYHKYKSSKKERKIIFFRIIIKSRIDINRKFYEYEMGTIGSLYTVTKY